MSTIPPDAHLMIIGAMKAGTSALFSLLAQHPMIAPCCMKEPEYFSERQIHGIKNKKMAYASLWDFDPTQHRYALEASTGYSKFPREQNVPANIAAAGLQPVFIYLVRDPVARAFSQYCFAHAVGKVNPDLPVTDNQYVDFSRYHTQLQHYRQYFPAQSFVLVDFDELARSPQALLQGLCQRLQLPAIVFDLDRMDRHATPASGLLLADTDRQIIHKMLESDMQAFARDYDFPVQKWGF